MNRPDFLDLSLDFPPTYVKGLHRAQDVIKMPYKTLGNTDMKISKFGFGSCQLGHLLNTDKESEAIRVVEEAVKMGVNYFDVAPWYGFGTSEIVLGKALRRLPRQSYYIATKVGRYQSDYPNMFDFSAEKTLESVNISLEKLGVDCVDLIQVHDVEFAPSIDIIINETLPTLQKVKESGKARYIGVTGYPLSKLKEVIEKSPVKIDTVLSYSPRTLNGQPTIRPKTDENAESLCYWGCRYNLIDQELLNYIPYFKEKGIGIINASYLGMGLLTPYQLPSWHCATSEIKDACQRANQYCREKGVSLPRLAASYALELDDPATHLVGFASLELLNDNMRNLFEPLDEMEGQILDYILETYFKPLKVKNWEGIEVAKYWRKIDAYNKQSKVA